MGAANVMGIQIDTYLLSVYSVWMSALFRAAKLFKENDN